MPPARSTSSAEAEALPPRLMAEAPTEGEEDDQPRTARGERVLDEDAWAGALEAIVERDYFPDVPRLRSQLAWLTGGDAGAAAEQERERRRQEAGAAGRPDGPLPRLDAFCAANTGEDNASFASLLAADTARRAARSAAAGAAERAPRNALEAPKGGAHGAKTMFLPPPPRGSSATALPAGSRAAVVPAGTRFAAVPGESDDGGPTTRARKASSGVETPRGGAGPRSLLATPVHGPGAGETPIMTWGELGSTPLRLDGAAAGRGGGAASGFRVQSTPRREQLGRRLAPGGAAASLSGRGRERVTPRHAGTQTPGKARVPGTPRTPLSAAGTELLRKLSAAGADGEDMGLRRSYQGTPVAARRAGGETPGSSWTPASTPLAAPPPAKRARR